MKQPSAITGVRCLTYPAGGDPRAPWQEGRIVLDLGGPPGAEVVGVEIDGRLVFRRLQTEVRVLFD